ncbi:MAG: CDP-diacylglycerol--serine O-phosphatidyltransferase [Desulfatiglandales bacterium]
MTSTQRRQTGLREKRGIFLLPNLFTSASLFGGFYAIIAVIHGRYEAAAIAIILSAICDGLDGRIARYTHTTSHFGAEYDSLADLVAFGVAPGLLVYKWALEPFGRLGWLAAFVYVICGALRLARFNTQKKGVESNIFRGLPIPSAACLIASGVLFSHEAGGIFEARPFVIIFAVYALSSLMVSKVNYLSFKKYDAKHRKPLNVLVGVILISMVVVYKPKIMLFFIMVSYAVSGPIVTLYRFLRRRTVPKATQSENSLGAEGVESNDEKKKAQYAE